MNQHVLSPQLPRVMDSASEGPDLRRWGRVLRATSEKILEVRYFTMQYFGSFYNPTPPNPFRHPSALEVLLAIFNLFIIIIITLDQLSEKELWVGGLTFHGVDTSGSPGAACLRGDRQPSQMRHMLPL